MAHEATLAPARSKQWRMAGLVLGVLPLLGVYMLLQRFLVGGLAGGAVKG